MHPHVYTYAYARVCTCARYVSNYFKNFVILQLVDFSNLRNPFDYKDFSIFVNFSIKKKIKYNKNLLEKKSPRFFFLLRGKGKMGGLGGSLG